MSSRGGSLLEISIVEEDEEASEGAHVLDDFSSHIGSDVTIWSNAGKLSMRQNRLNGKASMSDDGLNSLAGSSSTKYEENLIQSASKVIGLTGYNVAGIDPEVKVSYVEVINRILLRENALINVRKISQTMDVLYWKYCVNRIRIFGWAKDKCVRKQASDLSRCQEELTVAIAHYRSATMDCITKVYKYQELCQKKHGTEDGVVVLWRGLNYLLKMNVDVKSLHKSHTLRLWLGFEPNALMQPPVDHDPHQAHKELLDQFQEWLGRHKEHRRKMGKKFMPITFVLSAGELEDERAEYAALDKAGDEAMNGEDGGEEEEEEEEEGLAAPLDENEEGDEGSKADDAATTAAATVDTMDTKLLLVEVADADWMGIRNYSEPIWVESEKEDFWLGLDWDPKAVNAAVGFPEAFPRFFVVPPLPPHLVGYCIRLQQVLAREQRMFDRQVERARKAAVLKEMITATVTTDVVAGIAAGFRDQEVAEHMFHMRERQEGGNGDVGIQIGLQRIASESLIPPPPIVDEVDEEDEFFMTGLNGPQGPEPVKRTRGLKGPVAFAKPNIRRITEVVSDKVHRERNITVRHGHHLVIRPGMRRQDEGVEIPLYDVFEACMIIQRLGGLFLRKRKAKAAEAVRFKEECIRLVQRVARGMNGRRRFKEEKKAFSTEYMVLRKLLVRKEYASFTVTKFMRKAAYVYRKARELANLDAVIGEQRRKRVVRTEVVRYDAAATLIGRCWRGRMGRSRFWMAARGVFLLAKRARHELKRAATAAAETGMDISMSMSFVDEDGQFATASEAVSTGTDVAELNRIDKERRAGIFVPEDYLLPLPTHQSARLLSAWMRPWLSKAKKDSEVALVLFRQQVKSSIKKSKSARGPPRTSKMLPDMWPLACSWPYRLRPVGADSMRVTHGGLLAGDDEDEGVPARAAVTITAGAEQHFLPAMGSTADWSGNHDGHHEDGELVGPSGTEEPHVQSNTFVTNSAFMTQSASLDNISLGSSAMSDATKVRVRRTISRDGLTGHQLVEAAKKTTAGMRDPVGGSRLLPDGGKSCGGGKMLSALRRSFVDDPRLTVMAPCERQEVYVSPCLEDYVKRAEAKKAFARTQLILNPPAVTVSREERLGSTLRKVFSHSSIL